MNKLLDDLIEKERLALLVNIKALQEGVDLASDAWAWTFTPNYLHLKDGCQLAIAYKSQSDQGMSQAILSIMRQHYAQAASRLRFAVENLTISLAMFVEPTEMLTKFGDKSIPTMTTDEKIRDRAYEIMKNFDAQLNKDVFSLKKTLSENGSHQSAGLLGGSINLRQSGVTTFLQDTPQPALTAAILGLVAETAMLFHPAFERAVRLHDLAIVKETAIEKYPEIRSRADAYKSGVRNLFPQF